jgi:hypothetical protein
MSNKSIYYIGILGAVVFVISSILGGFLIDNYSISSQLISETYAIDTEYGLMLRGFGIIPSGILLTLFSFISFKKFPESRLTKIGFYGLGIFYGIATIIVGIFPCDSGCNKGFIDPSISQVIHNLTGFLTYLFVPISIILIGLGLKKSPSHYGLSIQGITYGVLSIIFVYFISSDPTSEYAGVYQRIAESLFVIWIVTCAIAIRNKKHLPKS